MSGSHTGDVQPGEDAAAKLRRLEEEHAAELRRLAPLDQRALADVPVHGAESHHDLAAMREVRRQRVEAAFGPAERSYLEALEAVADAIRSTGSATHEMSALLFAETTAAQKGRH